MHGYDELLVDLAVDSPPSSTPMMTVVEPSFAALELAGRKLLALFGRAEARDFADAFVLAQRYGKDALLEQASLIDPGVDERVLAQMMASLGRFDDDEIPAVPSGVPQLRAFFAQWGAELGPPDAAAPQ